jgi:hypothetical protein
MYPMRLYIYNADGTYGEPILIPDRPAFDAHNDAIRAAIRNKLEVRITDPGDSMMLHARLGHIIWDGELHHRCDVCCPPKAEPNTPGVRPGRGDDEISIPTKCPRCAGTKVLVVKATDHRRWQKGEFVQKAFPYLSTDDRERLISGTCPTCWDELFPEE